MRRFASTIVLAYLTLAALSGDEMFAQNSNSAEAEAKMFAASAGYERFMGRWSRLLAPAYIAFAGVKNGDRVLDVGTGTGSLAATLEATMPTSEIVGVDPALVGLYRCAEAEHGRGPVRRGIVVRDRAADRPHVAYLAIADALR